MKLVFKYFISVFVKTYTSYTSIAVPCHFLSQNYRLRYYLYDILALYLIIADFLAFYSIKGIAGSENGDKNGRACRMVNTRLYQPS